MSLIKFLRIFRFFNRRRYERYQAIPPVEGRCHDPNQSEKECRITMTNISESGFYAKTWDAKLPFSQKIEFCFELPREGKYFVVKGVVVRHGRSGPVCHYFAAVKFEDTDRKLIHSFVDAVVPRK